MSLESPPSSLSPSPGPETTDSKKRKALPELEVDLKLPEPPSKKAKRALKKGKPLPPSKNPAAGDEDDGDDKAASKDGKKKKEERSQHGVWIGNLPFTMTRPELFQWIVDNSGGSITAEQITRVNLPTSKIPPRPMPGHAPGVKRTQNKGFAYVDFDTFEANVAAIALSETEINGRKLLIKDSKSYEGRPQKPTPAASTEDKAQKEESTSRKIFVGNLGFDITENDLWWHFEKCGEIDWVKVATFEDSGKCKGYGWVKFREATAVEWAVKGFVKIAEEASDDEEDEPEDDQDDDEQEQEKPADDVDADEEHLDAADGEAEAETESKKAKPKPKPKQPKKAKTRKWWVNRLKGRELKIQVAEDDKVRYQKRYGGKKGASQGKNGAGNVAGAASNADGDKGEDAQDSSVSKKPFVKKEKPAKFYEDIDVARRTGAVVAPQGKRTTFE